ncbi:hypothetical protein N9Q06_01230 [bacterium]|nr:hypothetical protein [bacterium]
MISLGLENYSQIDPVGSYKGNIGAVDLQYSRFLGDKTYWYYALGVGFKGLETYNQILGGIGMRFALAPRINVYGQVGIGSGGYAPALIDTGSGLLVYPKVSAEYSITDRLGLAVTVGYLAAPDATSKNLTYGISLNSHFRKARKGGKAADGGKYNGHRFTVSNETKLNLSVHGIKRDKLNLLTVQYDKIFNDNLYMPVRGNIALASYKGNPGYGEIAIGLGVQTKYSENRPFQFLGELQAGANVEGPFARAGVGVIYGLKEDIALRGMLSETMGRKGFRSTNLELGMTYRFSTARF